MKKISLIAHRGASSLAPENTLAAFQMAIDLKADAIELDLRLTKDLHLVALHDASLKRTRGIAKTIHQLTLKEIRALNLETAIQIPTLQEILELVGTKTRLMLEIKQGVHPPQVIVDVLFNILTHFPSPIAGLVIGSFSIGVVKLIKRNEGKLTCIHPIKTVGIVERASCIAPFLKIGVDILAAWHPLLPLEAHARVLPQEIWVFTVDEKRLAEKMILNGATGIITNNIKIFN